MCEDFRSWRIRRGWPCIALISIFFAAVALQDDDFQPGPKWNWPKGRTRVEPGLLPHQTLSEAFRWPEKIKSAVKLLNEPSAGLEQAIIFKEKVLTVSSHFSGVCTQSRAAMVLESHGISPRFKHARGPVVFVIARKCMGEFVNFCNVTGHPNSYELLYLLFFKIYFLLQGFLHGEMQARPKDFEP